MNLKSIVICLYAMLIYWCSQHFTFLDTLFFPTLGAFSLLFISRTYHLAEFRNIIFGAFLCSIIGTALYYISPGVISLFINAVITIWMINRFKWNAPPIIAVAFIPYFSKSTHLWAIPLSVGVALVGLMFILLIVHRAENRWGHLLNFFVKKQDVVKS